MKTFQNSLLQAALAVVDNKDFLTRADQAIGDGDHGVGMARGFQAFADALGKLEDPDPATMLAAGGRAIMMTSGGASGAIFGTFFSAAGKDLSPGSVVDAQGLAKSFAAGLEAVKQRGKAKAGDKTMIDAAEPAIASLSKADGPLETALRDAADAARAGAERTRDMIATTGKAKSLGERSLGHPDPGALTFTIFMEALARGISDTSDTAAVSG